MMPNGIAGAIGAGLDRWLGEPPTPWHPVAWFGRTMSALERRTYRDSRLAGVAHLGLGVGLALGTGLGLRKLVGAPFATLIAATISIAGRMLTEEAAAVSTAVRDGDLDAARLRLRSLVGRDADTLDGREIVRAAIESVAENTVDAVTAPLMWAAIGGAPAVLAHRAINTLDAMVGHRTVRYARFGWAAARTDDLVNWLPARLTAVTVGVVRPSRALAVAATVRRDARQHPSPNGGVIESAFAAALDVRLGGTNRYGGAIEDRGQLGDGPAPAVADGARAVRLARQVTAVFAIGCAVLPAAARLVRRGRHGSAMVAA